MRITVKKLKEIISEAASGFDKRSIIGRYLLHIGYVPHEDENMIDAWRRLQHKNPDLFPVPRADQSLYDACLEVLEQHGE